MGFSKEICIKHSKSSTLHDAVAALKKDNSEGMKLIEREKHNYTEIFNKDIDTSLEDKILKYKCKTVETDAMDMLKIMDFEININAKYSIFQDNMNIQQKC